MLPEQRLAQRPRIEPELAARAAVHADPALVEALRRIDDGLNGAIAAGSLVTGVIYAVLKRSETAVELAPAT